MADLPRLRHASGRPLRLAHLTTVDMSLALLLATELAAQVEAGLEVFGLSAPGPYVDRVTALGVRHVPLPALTRSWDLGRDARAAGQLVRAVRRIRPDVLHVHNPKTGVLGRLLGRLCRVPVVVNTCHGLWLKDEDPALRRGAVVGLEAAASWFSDAELFQNEADLVRLRRWMRPGAGRVVGNGTDLARFRPDREERRRVRDGLGVRDDVLLVGGIGRVVAEKGIRELAEVARALDGRARFVWAGPADPSKPDALHELAPLEHLGEVTDPAGLYNALDVFVLPSYREGFSRSAMEAAATGLPMVLSDIRGCREIGRDDEELLLVPPRDPVALTSAVELLLADASLRARLGAAARVRALSHFDQRAVAARSSATYREVAARRRLAWTEVGP